MFWLARLQRVISSTHLQPQRRTRVRRSRSLTFESMENRAMLAATSAVLLHDFGAGSTVTELSSVNGRELFKVVLPSSPGSLVPPSEQLWASNGTASGTLLLQSFSSTLEETVDFTDLGTSVGGKELLKVVENPTDGSPPYLSEQLWATDGTAAGTKLLQGFTSTFTESTDFIDLGTSVGGKELLKIVENPNDGSPPYLSEQLWATDGTAAGTKLLQGFTSTFTESTDFIDLGTSVGGKELLKIVENPNDGSPPYLSEQLWATDGTAAGTKLLQGFTSTSAEAIDFSDLNTNVGGKELFKVVQTPPAWRPALSERAVVGDQRHCFWHNASTKLFKQRYRNG